MPTYRNMGERGGLRPATPPDSATGQDGGMKRGPLSILTTLSGQYAQGLAARKKKKRLASSSPNLAGAAIDGAQKPV